MCKQCVDAVREVFPEVPPTEFADFLFGTTCFPAGNAERVRAQLAANRAKMKSTDYRECYAIADEEMIAELNHPENSERRVVKDCLTTEED